MKRMANFDSALTYSKEIATEVEKKFPKANKAVLNNLKRLVVLFIDNELKNNNF